MTIFVAVSSILAALLIIVGFLYYKHIKRSGSALSLQQRVDNLLQQVDSLQQDCAKISQEQARKQEELHVLDIKIATSSSTLSNIQEKNTLLQSQIEEKKKMMSEQFTLAETHYQSKLDSLNAYHKNRLETAQKEWQISTEQLESDYLEAKSAFSTELAALNDQVEEERRTLLIAQAQNRKDNEDDSTHYLPIPASDQYEIKEIMEVCGRLRNPIPLYKALYDVYYKTPLATMVGDLEARGKCGIYKITNKLNGKIYIGQSVDIGERWKQHLKRGCGAEVGTISGSKLYSAMMAENVWNFRFEIVESDLEKSMLNSREKYWINYFNSVENGYNMKAGG